MTTITEVGARIEALKADRTAREARLAEIGPQADELRAKLRRARGEAELGDAQARKTASELERRLAALAGEEDAATGAIEVLGERIAAAEVELATAKADEKASIEAACRAAEEEAFSEFRAAMAATVPLLQRMAAARQVAVVHGVETPNRGNHTRKRLYQSAGAYSARDQWRRDIHHPGASGIPEELAELAFRPGVESAVQDLVAELRRTGLPIRDVDVPEPEQPRGPEMFFEPAPPARPRSETEVTEVIRMGRGAPVETDAVGRPVEQSARPSANHRGERRQSSPRVVADFIDPRTARGS